MKILCNFLIHCFPMQSPDLGQPRTKNQVLPEALQLANWDPEKPAFARNSWSLDQTDGVCSGFQFTRARREHSIAKKHVDVVCSAVSVSGSLTGLLTHAACRAQWRGTMR